MKSIDEFVVGKLYERVLSPGVQISGTTLFAAPPNDTELVSFLTYESKQRQEVGISPVEASIMILERNKLWFKVLSGVGIVGWTTLGAPAWQPCEKG